MPYDRASCRTTLPPAVPPLVSGSFSSRGQEGIVAAPGAAAAAGLIAVFRLEMRAEASETSYVLDRGFGSPSGLWLA